ncbi:N-acetylglucosamine kinase, partial [human gut metagenome]
YREPAANRFLASFAPFIRAHLDSRTGAGDGRPLVRRVRRAQSVGLSGRSARCLCRRGAAHFEEPLREAMAAAGREVVRIVCSPAEELWKYHGGESDYRAELGV